MRQIYFFEDKNNLKSKYIIRIINYVLILNTVGLELVSGQLTCQITINGSTNC